MKKKHGKQTEARIYGQKMRYLRGKETASGATSATACFTLPVLNDIRSQGFCPVNHDGGWWKIMRVKAKANPRDVNEGVPSRCFGAGHSKA